MTTTAEHRVAATLDFIEQWAGFDGVHHKQWVIDQAVRLLCGGELCAGHYADVTGTEEYLRWVDNYCNGCGPDTYEGDEGVAP